MINIDTTFSRLYNQFLKLKFSINEFDLILEGLGLFIQGL